MDKKIRLVQVAYKSEWALAKFFQALQDEEIAKKFELIAICGRESTKEKTINSLELAIKERVTMISKEKFRSINREKEIDSAVGLMKQLAKDQIQYYPVNGNQTLPHEIYKNNFDALVIHSKNITHLGYIFDGIKHGKHILCEKPLVTVLDARGRPKIKDLEELTDITNNIKELTLMDAEHYSYKQASLIFYENIQELLGGSKIKKIEGCIKERDDPDFGRTKDVLQAQNETGLLTDTCVHLLAFISNLNGKPMPTGIKYGIYPKYDVETYIETDYKIEGDSPYFTKDATANLTVGKFIDKFKIPEIDESKFIKFTLEDESQIIINFREGSVKKNGVEYDFRYSISNNEYVNILNHFNTAIRNNQKPLTDFKKSINTLQSIYDTHKSFLLNTPPSEIYK
jgi:predicted dehydrogenase